MGGWSRRVRLVLGPGLTFASTSRWRWPSWLSGSWRRMSRVSYLPCQAQPQLNQASGTPLASFLDMDPTMEVSNGQPTVFYFRNRTLILVAAPPLAALCVIEIVNDLRSGEPWLNWLAGLALWIFLLLVAMRRRLVFSAQGLEYTEFFTTVRVPWTQVTRLVSRKTLGIWRVEGIEAWTGAPMPRDVFIELTQFSRSWRHSSLGAVLKSRAPHLFGKESSTRE